MIDLSGLALESLPDGATLKGLIWLTKAVLPTGLRKLPKGFFQGCWRLSSSEAGRTALEEIDANACGEGRSLTVYPFPPTVRTLSKAFSGTSITTIDLSGTEAESIRIGDMTFLVTLILPRRCTIEELSTAPSLRTVTFGVSRGGNSFGWHPTEVRFEGLATEDKLSSGLLESSVYGEVACALGCETRPFPPP
jgi:hypothetical protein